MIKFTWDELQDLNRIRHNLSEICDARQGDCSVCPLARDSRSDYCLYSEINDLLFKHTMLKNEQQANFILLRGKQ